MKERSAYHPLRQLIIKGNPNRNEVNDDAYKPPLTQYLEVHNIDPEAYNAFIKKVNCEIITPFNSQFDIARMQSDNAYNKYPLLVVYCTCTADVVESIKFCDLQNIAVTLRAGGHNTAGYCVTDGRMLIDVSNIKGMFIDEKNMVSEIGAGITWGEYNYELNAYGLHNPGGSCDSVGVTGYTMGGGYGYTSMRWGIACDNLLEIKMVTAKGDIVIANKDANAELLWAHKGGTGGNFGIVVSLKFQLYKLKEVWPIEVNWPIEDAAKVLVTWQNKMTKTLGDRNLGILGFLATREIKESKASGTATKWQPYFCIRGIYSGEDSGAAQNALAPLLAVGGPQYPSGPLWKHKIPYAEANEHLLDNVEGVIPDTIKETKRCSYINKPLTESQYEKMIKYFITTPSLYNIVSMEPYGGAINEVPGHATAFVHRDAYFDIFTDSFWMLDSEKAEAFEWLKNYYESPGTKELWSEYYYQNYPNSEYKDWQNGYFGNNYKKLQQVKKKWDPANKFNFPQSIEIG